MVSFRFADRYCFGNLVMVFLLTTTSQTCNMKRKLLCARKLAIRGSKDLKLLFFSTLRFLAFIVDFFRLHQQHNTYLPNVQKRN